MNKIALGLLACAALFNVSAAAQPVEGIAWKTGREAARIERRIDGLLARMTLDEKVGQLNLSGRGDGFDIDKIRTGDLGSVMNFVDPKEVLEVQRAARQSRLKIPLLIGLDAVHGFSTYFPLPLGQAATWNPALIEEAAYWTGREAKAAGINWTFAPMVDMSRDPRWGRVLEGAGEDSYLGLVVAAARTRGYQRGGVATSVKHFAGYGGAEGGRDYNSAWIPTSQMHDWYLPPFKAALDQGAMTVMAAFHAVNGVPASAHRELLTGVLRERWKFRGFVTSDFGAIPELTLHGVARDDAEAARLALNAGIDMDMMGSVYRRYLAEEVRAGRVKQATVDQAVRRVLRVKFHLGLFEAADVDPASADAKLQTAEARDVARRIAREAIVLLKNDGGLLPLARGGRQSIAVIGTLARPDNERLWTDPAGFAPRPIQPLAEAIAERMHSEARVTYAPAFTDLCATTYADRDGAIAQAMAADLVVAMLGEDCAFMGEAASRTVLDLPGVQQDLLKALVATGKPVILVLATGRPLVLTWAHEHVAAIVQTFHGGTEARVAIAEILFGDVSPSGRTPMSYPRSVGQIPVYYDQLPTGRPEKIRQRYESIYIDEANEALYPFGHGLSYTRFTYAAPMLSRTNVSLTGEVIVTVEVTNAGGRAGSEVVQLYVRHPVASRSRPVRQLKGFAKIVIAAGATRKVEFRLKAADLGFHDDKGRYRIEPGPVDIYLGGSSLARAHARFDLVASRARLP
jgi:beta-glucosidase